jgi:hypothetical protein
MDRAFQAGYSDLKMTSGKMLKGFLLSGLVTSLVAAVLPGSSPKQAAIIENNFDKLTFSPYVERDFPFISTYLDAGIWDPGFPMTT